MRRQLPVRFDDFKIGAHSDKPTSFIQVGKAVEKRLVAAIIARFYPGWETPARQHQIEQPSCSFQPNWRRTRKAQPRRSSDVPGRRPFARLRVRQNKLTSETVTKKNERFRSSQLGNHRFEIVQVVLITSDKNQLPVARAMTSQIKCERGEASSSKKIPDVHIAPRVFTQPMGDHNRSLGWAIWDPPTKEKVSARFGLEGPGN